MYISYAMSVALAFITGAAVYVLGNDPDLWVYLLVVTLSLIILGSLHVPVFPGIIALFLLRYQI